MLIMEMNGLLPALLTVKNNPELLQEQKYRIQNKYLIMPHLTQRNLLKLLFLERHHKIFNYKTYLTNKMIVFQIKYGFKCKMVNK
jgi:hypothetical protein